MQIIFLGPPGAGKGTQAEILSNKLNIPHLSSGLILRQISKQQSKVSNLLKETMNKGLLVSDGLIINVVEERIKMRDCKSGFILDGFPRTIIQAENLDLILKKINKKINFVFQIDVSEDILIKRITGRQICSKCSTTYNKFFDPIPKEGCRNCGGKDIKVRGDDDENAFKNVRLQKYNTETKPLIDYYKDRKILSSFDGTISRDEISNNITDYIEFI